MKHLDRVSVLNKCIVNVSPICMQLLLLHLLYTKGIWLEINQHHGKVLFKISKYMGAHTARLIDLCFLPLGKEGYCNHF